MSEGLLIVLAGVAVVVAIVVEESLKKPSPPSDGGDGSGSNSGTGSGSSNSSPNPPLVPLPFEQAPVPPVAGAYACPKYANADFGMYFVPQQPWGGVVGDVLLSDRAFSPYDDKATPLVFGGFKYWVRQWAVAGDSCGDKP